MKVGLFTCLFLMFSFLAYGENCTLDVNISASSTTICSGNSVILTANTSGGTAPLSYIWSTGQTSKSISVNKAGTYSVTVSDNTTGCQAVKKDISITTSLAPDAPTARGASICPNTSTTLTATAPGGNYQWYDANGNFLVSAASYTTPVLTSNTTYFVQTTLSACTSERTAVTVNLVNNPVVTGATVCYGSAATLSATGEASYTWYNAASGGSALSNGNTYTTPPLTASKTYYVVGTTGSCTSVRIPVTANVLQPPAAPAVSNITICSGSSANLHATAQAGTIDWFDVPSGGTSLISSPDYTTPPLTVTTTYYVQITVNECVSNRTPVTVTINSPPATPAPQTDSTCYNTSLTLTAAGNSPSYNWYDAGQNLIATGNTYTTPALTSSTIYYLQALNGSCSSGLGKVIVVVRPALAAPSASGAIICYRTAAVLHVSPQGGTYEWFSAASGGTSLANDTVYTTPPLTASTTYFVERITGSCVSPRTAVTATVLTQVAPPTAPNATVCYGNGAVLTANSPTGNYAWYSASAGGTLLSIAQVYVTPDLTATTTYYVETSALNGCVSSRTPVQVTVNPTPIAPIVDGTTVCPGTSADLTAAAPERGILQWYDSATGGTLLASGNTYHTPVLNSSATYYVENIATGCTGPRTAVTVSLYTRYDPGFQYPFGTYCTTGANVVPVIIDPAGGTFSASPSGLVFVSTTMGEINVRASTPGIYTVSFTSKGPCTSISTEYIGISANPNPNFSYDGPYCQDGTDPLPTLALGATAGTFTATPEGLVFFDKTTGKINLAESTAGTYMITNTIPAGGSCPASTASATLMINQRVIVNAGPTQSVAEGSAVQLAGSITGGITNGTWTGGTGSFSDPTDPKTIYSPGAGETSAILTLTSADPPGACGPKSAKVVINFLPKPAAPTANSVTVCDGSTATLSATAPGGTYHWYDALTGGTLLATGPDYNTLPLTANTSYYVETTFNGVTSDRTKVNVTVNVVPVPPTVADIQTCSGMPATLTATGSSGSYNWFDAAVGGNLVGTGNTYTTPALTTNTSYYVQAVFNGCSSTRARITVNVVVVPYITSAPVGSVCSGDALDYTITASDISAIFTWSRAQVINISNPPTTQTSSSINERLINTGTSPVKVIYSIIPETGSCTGAAFSYIVTVYPQPAVTSAPTDTICNQSMVNYSVGFNTSGIEFSWSRAEVAGISNAAVSGQAGNTIRETLQNTTTMPVTVIYTYNYQTGTCKGTPFNLMLTVNPTVTVTSSNTGSVCSGTAENYAITSNVSSAAFNWSRAQVNGIANMAVSNQTSSVITETLVNTTSNPVTVNYIITPSAYGCHGNSMKYSVVVNPFVNQPVANGNSPVCVGSTIHLRTLKVNNAHYLWTGPNAYSSTAQNPDITDVSTANTGVYTLIDIVNGCPSPPAYDTIMVDAPPLAIAGPDQTVCFDAAAVQLNGTVTGGTTTGIWTTTGSGTFSPSANTLNAQYIPSNEDREGKSVILTLASTSKDDCSISMSNLTATFGQLPGADAGPDRQVCSQDASIALSGKQLVPGNVRWITSGSGSFSPTDSQANSNYFPSAQDIKNRSVILTLSVTNGGSCYLPDSMKINFIPPPTVNAGGTRYVLRGNTITLNPSVSTDSVTYLWSPDVDIDNDTLKNPTITGDVDRTYMLTVTDKRGCTSSGQTFIKVSPHISVTNTFTPNGDGINDVWEITGLTAYVNAKVEIFNRYGQLVFRAIGYPKPWDGTYGGKALPTGVYYYVINLNVNDLVLSGYVTIVR
jgi:gliding motility-associated-like protein